MVESQAQLHGFDPTEAILELKPRAGEDCLRTGDIVDFIKLNGNTISVVLISTVQYLTGQLFETGAIVKAAHAQVKKHLYLIGMLCGDGFGTCHWQCSSTTTQ